MKQSGGGRERSANDYIVVQAVGQFLARQPRPAVAIIGVAAIGVVALLDYWLTIFHITLLVLYLIPIFVLAWFVDGRAGLAAALVCGVVNFAIDLAHAGAFMSPAELYANGGTAVIIYLLTARTAAALKQLLDQEHVSARIDYSTGVANRRAFFELAELEIQRARRYQRPFAVAAIDLDNFKRINDGFGHAVGDRLLCVMAEIIKNGIRANDVVARFGGDEFAILLPESDGEAARAVIDRVQQRIDEAMRSNGWQVTVSIGLATFVHPPASTDDMMKKADDLLYAAKRSGKNMIRQAVGGD